VPIQSVTTLNGQQVAYVQQGNNTMAAPVEIGVYNDKFIQIRSGLKEGDRILLAPPMGNETQDLNSANMASMQQELAREVQTAANRPPRNEAQANGMTAPTSAPVAASDAERPALVPITPAVLEGGAPEGETREARMQRMREEMEQLSPEEREARMQAFRERRGGGGGFGGPGEGGGPGGRERRNPANNPGE
jgi:hypothetical protein